MHLSRIALIEPRKDELHRLRWEVKALQGELSTVRETISSSALEMHESKEIANDQTAAIVRLKAERVEDRKRIQRLLALTQPVGGDVAFLKDGR